MTQVRSLKTGIKFKDTPIGKVPVDWEVAQIGDICEVIGGSTPSTTNKEYWNGNILWATPTDITALKGRTIEDTKQKISAKGLTSCSANILPEGSILMTSRATIGACVINTKPMATNQGFASLVCKERVSNWFIYYLVSLYRKELERLGTGSTFKEVSKKTVKALHIPLPPLTEQKMIADILTNIDNAIEETDRIIKKSKELKKGLMQNLITRGIGHKKFKETEIGEMPEEWRIDKLKELYESPIRDFGSFSTTKLVKYVDEGVPFLRSEHFKDGRFSTDNIMYITDEAHKLLLKSIIKKGDLLFTKIGNIGHADIYHGQYGECNSNATIAKININERKAYKNYIRWVLNSKIAIKQFRGKIISTPPRINLGEISELKIPLPNYSEQKEIASILNNSEASVIEEENRIKQLEYLKKSLMQVLLTGKTRVKIN